MIGTLRAVVLDAPDVRRLAGFYTALGGWTEVYGDDDGCLTSGSGTGRRLGLAQPRPGTSGPTWAISART